MILVHTISVLGLLGLVIGSFINALVWRLYQQPKAESQKQKIEFSITRGRSMCPHCRHVLAAKDLIPVISWLSLRGKCRYCKKPISSQYPLVEATTAVLFVASYIWWPYDFSVSGTMMFVLWLAMLTVLVALLIYDLRWMFLPNRLVYPLIGMAVVFALVRSVVVPGWSIGSAVTGLLSVGGFFYVLFQISRGKWIGGGDVKLGFGLGLILGGASLGLLMVFVASWLGSLVSIPLLISKKKVLHRRIPFGPFLILATVLIFFVGQSILNWYRTNILYL